VIYAIIQAYQYKHALTLLLLVDMAFPPFGTPTTTSVHPLMYNVRRVHMTPHSVTIRRKQHSFRASCIIGLALGLVLSIFWFLGAAGMAGFDSDNEAFATDSMISEE